LHKLALFIRSALFHTFLLVTVAPWSILSIVTAVLPRPTHYAITMFWLKIAMWAAKVFLGIRYHVTGDQYLNANNVILLSKHQSTWETFFFPTYIKKQMCYVFKRELLMVPFFGWGIGLLDMIHIDRSKVKDAFEGVVTQGAKKLAQGRWIVMFPEGTRTPVGSQGNYRSGGVRLAQRTGATIIPVAAAAGHLWPKKGFLKYPGTVQVSFGPPIQCGSRSTDAVLLEVEQWIETEMRRLEPTLYSGPWQSRSNS
jgi:1-acyl-sn-glycerol-3-phosphate acyltransferase